MQMAARAVATARANARGAGRIAREAHSIISRPRVVGATSDAVVAMLKWMPA